VNAVKYKIQHRLAGGHDWIDLIGVSPSNDIEKTKMDLQYWKKRLSQAYQWRIVKVTEEVIPE